MIYLNLHLPSLRSPEFVGSEPLERATWVCLIAYCCEQENGGIIKGAAKWTDRQWQQTCGVLLSEVQFSKTMITMEGDDVSVLFYPLEQEIFTKKKREIARENGLKGGRQKNPERTDKEPTLVPTLPPTLESVREKKEKSKSKSKSKEKEIPPNPQGVFSDGTGEVRLPTTDQSKRICGIMKRKLTTRWSEDEYKLYRQLKVIPEEDMVAVEEYYKTDEEGKWHRKSMTTFLKHFSGEVDKARNWKPLPPVNNSRFFSPQPKIKEV